MVLLELPFHTSLPLPCGQTRGCRGCLQASSVALALLLRCHLIPAPAACVLCPCPLSMSLPSGSQTSRHPMVSVLVTVRPGPTVMLNVGGDGEMK